MSRTIRGNKAPGYEFWSRRPESGGVGPESKRICHGKERSQGRQELRRQVEELSDEEMGFLHG